MSKNITVDRSDVDDDEITTAFDMLFGPDMPPLYLRSLRQYGRRADL